jgi:diguanylate cyclase (GGDEF)-like protein
MRPQRDFFEPDRLLESIRLDLEKARKAAEELEGIKEGKAAEVSSTLLSLSRSISEILALYEISRTVGAIMAPSKACEKILEIIEGVVDYHRGTIFLLTSDEEGDEPRLVPMAIKGGIADYIPEISFKLGNGLSAWVAQEGRLVVIPERLGESQRNDAFISVPMIVQGEVVGVINLMRSPGPPFSDEEIRFLVIVSSQAASTIQHITTVRNLNMMATTDELTGLSNRRVFESRLFEELKRAMRYKQPMALLLIDLDEFKLLNDTYGHKAGDMVLKAFGKLLRKECRISDFPARYGGDEFAVILPNTTKEDAVSLAKRLMKRISGMTIGYKEKEIKMPSLSIGVSGYPEDGSDPNSLFLIADSMMYKVKKEGGCDIGVADKGVGECSF